MEKSTSLGVGCFVIYFTFCLSKVLTNSFATYFCSHTMLVCSIVRISLLYTLLKSSYLRILAYVGSCYF